MSELLTIECGPADEFGRRLVLARAGESEHRDRFNTDDAFRRQRFAESALTRFGWPLTQEVLAEIDAKLVGEADAEDTRPRPSACVAADSVCLADVPAMDVAWLWPGRIALGKVTLLCGDPGLGKSMVTLDIAARVSRGVEWPHVAESLRDSDGTSWQSSGECFAARQGEAATSHSRLGETRPHVPGGVVLLSAEDDLADTIRPRLEAHNADCSQIVAIRAIEGNDVDGDYRRSFDLSRDLPHLTATLDRMRNCRLVVIDPISAYLGKAGENFNAEVRTLMGPLADLASRYKLAVIAVTHLRKGEGAAIYRAMGSLAFVAAARSAWMIRKDARDPERRLLLPMKNNLASDVGGLAYRVAPAGPGGTATIQWSDELVHETADDVSTNKPGPAASERNEVARWLRIFLAEGPQPTTEVYAAAAAHGYSTATLRRAFRELHGNAIKRNGHWLWKLPEGGEAEVVTTPSPAILAVVGDPAGGQPSQGVQVPSVGT